MWHCGSFACLGSPARTLRDLHPEWSPLGLFASLPAFFSPACRGAQEGHTPASAHQLHALSACQACLPMARFCLLSLLLHVPNVFTKLETLAGGVGGSRLHLELRSSEQLLSWGAQGWRLWPGTATLPLETLSIGAKSCLLGTLIMLLPSPYPSCPRTTSLARPELWPLSGPSWRQPLLLGSQALPRVWLRSWEVVLLLPSSLPQGSWPGGGGSGLREGGHVTSGLTLCPAPVLL